MMNNEQMKLYIAEENFLRNFIPILADFNGKVIFFNKLKEYLIFIGTLSTVSASLGMATGGSLYSAAPERLSRDVDMEHLAVNFPLLGDIYS